MHNLQFDRSFPANYEVAFVDSPIIYFPPSARTIEKDVAVAVSRGDDVFTGLFQSGPMSSYGLYACPDPDQLCVLVGGTAYLVNVSRARTHDAWVYEFIKGIVPIPEASLLLMWTESGAIAHGRKEIWANMELCLDELKFIRTDGVHACFSGWNPPAGGPGHVSSRVEQRAAVGICAAVMLSGLRECRVARATLSATRAA